MDSLTYEAEATFTITDLDTKRHIDEWLTDIQAEKRSHYTQIRTYFDDKCGHIFAARCSLAIGRVGHNELSMVSKRHLSTIGRFVQVRKETRAYTRLADTSMMKMMLSKQCSLFGADYVSLKAGCSIRQERKQYKHQLPGQPDIPVYISLDKAQVYDHSTRLCFEAHYLEMELSVPEKDDCLFLLFDGYISLVSNRLGLHNPVISKRSLLG
jgi:hypothetical protein